MIVVTGASRGLGRAICERLLFNDVDVFGLARNTLGLPFQAMNCDVSSYEQVRQVAQVLKSQEKKITGLINAAGIASMNLAVTTPEPVSKKIIEINLLGTIYCCQLIAPLMIRNKSGSIVNFSTVAVALGLKGESVYVASKAGVEAFSRVFAREMSDFNVNVNCIAPGPIATDLLKGVTDEQITKIIDQQIIKKRFLTADICDVVEFLLKKESRSLSGQVFHIGGV